MINWNEAPEGATHHARMSNFEYLDYWLDDRGYWTEGEYYEFELKAGDRENYKRKEFSEITERPLPVKPVYTQEMNDNGLLPEEGMEFIDSGALYKDVRTCLFVDGDLAVYKLIGGDYQSAELSECEPLPKPIEPIDGMAYQFEHSGTTQAGIYAKPNRKFIARNDNHHESQCTNITLLTPEDK